MAKSKKVKSITGQQLIALMEPEELTLATASAKAKRAKQATTKLKAEPKPVTKLEPKVEPTTDIKVPKVEKVLTKEQQDAIDNMDKISDKIRYLDKQQYTTSQIAKFIDRRYQHVRNVLTTPLKRQLKDVK